MGSIDSGIDSERGSEHGDFVQVRDLFDAVARPCICCGYVKSHPHGIMHESFNSTHFTCVCNLFSDSVICCTFGYRNLLQAIPIIAIYTNLPTSYFWHLENAYDADMNIRSAELNDNLVQTCAQIKINAMNSVSYLSNRVSPAFVDDYIRH